MEQTYTKRKLQHNNYWKWNLISIFMGTRFMFQLSLSLLINYIQVKSHDTMVNSWSISIALALAFENIVHWVDLIAWNSERVWCLCRRFPTNFWVKCRRTLNFGSNITCTKLQFSYCKTGELFGRTSSFIVNRDNSHQLNKRYEKMCFKWKSNYFFNSRSGIWRVYAAHSQNKYYVFY